METKEGFGDVVFSSLRGVAELAEAGMAAISGSECFTAFISFAKIIFTKFEVLNIPTN